jgi:hypothetical protein
MGCPLPAPHDHKRTKGSRQGWVSLLSGTFTIETSLKAREDRARRVLAKYGYVLRKTPARSWLRQYYGPGYMIVEIHRNLVVSGCGSRPYQDRIEGIERYAFKPLPRQQTPGARP